MRRRSSRTRVAFTPFEPWLPTAPGSLAFVFSGERRRRRVAFAQAPSNTMSSTIPRGANWLQLGPHPDSFSGSGREPMTLARRHGGIGIALGGCDSRVCSHSTGNLLARTYEMLPRKPAFWLLVGSNTHVQCSRVCAFVTDCLQLCTIAMRPPLELSVKRHDREGWLQRRTDAEAGDVVNNALPYINLQSFCIFSSK